MSEPNPEFKAYGSDHMQWVEDWHAEFADATPCHDVLPRGRNHHTGWYLDSFQSETVHGVVLTIPSACPSCAGTGEIPESGDTENPALDCDDCDASGTTNSYVAGILDPGNENCVLVAREDTFDDAEDAARAADRLAELYAEDAREEDAKFQAEQQIESAIEDIDMARRAHSRLLTLDDAVGARLRQKQRSSAASAIKRIRLLRKEPWRAVE